MGLIEVVTGILPHLVTESNNNLCLGGGALNYAMQKKRLDTDDRKCNNPFSPVSLTKKGLLGVEKGIPPYSML